MKKAAVILCGSGHLDGSEIRESVAVLWALNDAKIATEIFAPDIELVDVMDHVRREPVVSPSSPKRNALIEAARIARGKIAPINQLVPANFDGLFLPGGFGVAKNLCTFAAAGAKATVLPDIEKTIRAFHQATKPIGAVCIAPALVALVLKDKKLELTLGEPGEASSEIEKLGHKHRTCSAHECITDHGNKVVTTPAYMYDDAELADVFRGVRALVQSAVQLSTVH